MELHRGSFLIDKIEQIRSLHYELENIRKNNGNTQRGPFYFLTVGLQTNQLLDALHHVAKAVRPLANRKWSRSGNYTVDESAREVQYFLDRAYDVMREAPVLFLDGDKVEFYEYPFRGWVDVVKKFPSATGEIDEASKCYALGRNTASVMHSMRILEIGLNAFAAKLDVPLDNPNWHNVIELIEKKLKTMGPNDGDDWKERKTYYSDVATHFQFVKDAWRNQAMHARQVYDEGQAKDILDHVRLFMAQLSVRLAEAS